MGYRQSLDAAISKIENQLKESQNTLEQKDREILEKVQKVANETKNSFDKYIEDIKILQETMVNQGTQITQYQKTSENNQRTQKSDLELLCSQRID